MYGVVTKYFRDRGYGFIKGEDGNSYFIHRSKLYGECEYNARDVIVIEAPERKRKNGKKHK